ncbi:MAG: hypothetical protein ABIX01_10800 [Chitinophagaceae bacterium]
MKTIYTIAALAFLFIGCASTKYDTSPTTTSVEKLIKKHNRKPEDTAVLNRLVFGYNLLHEQYLQEIETLKIRNTPRNWEAVSDLYGKVNELNTNASKNGDLYELLQPKNYNADINDAMLHAANGYYEMSIDLVNADNWREAREASTYLDKIKRLAGSNFKDAAQLTAKAMELATVDILIQPVRNEGFYYNNSNYGNQYDANRLSDQLVRDMGGEWSTYGRYRVYAADRYYNNGKDPDWIAEPLWTYWKTNPVQYNTSKRTVTKQIQTGKDSANRPIYKTISAVVRITQTTVTADGRLELRISDVKNQATVNSRTWNENYCWTQTYSSYTGDKDALSDEDWNLVRTQRNSPPREEQLQSEVLQKIYPDMLRWFKNIAE